MEQYGLIRKELMTGIADAIRAKKKTTAILTPEQMAAEIEGIITGDDLPNVEATSFGTVTEFEYGILSGISGTDTSTSNWGTKIKFKANETLGVHGMRGFVGKGKTIYLGLYDSAGTLIKSTSVTASVTGWNTVYFDTPVILIAGNTYQMFGYCAGGGGQAYQIQKCTYNSKITYQAYGYGSSNQLPDNDSYSSNYTWSIPDILIGPPITESVVTEYKIQVTTITDIADEVKRITGASGTLSTAQIITALQGMAAQTTGVTEGD